MEQLKLSIKPKSYPYSGKIKTSTTEIVKVWKKSYLDFIAENKRQQEKSEQELQRVIQKLYQQCH
ncbi:hypothetical protein [Streptococcus agalactiae]|uniref:hypothetical protein n=1 Tax=Streptococcus agalactiae TaxID=1311 RepID=UPI00085C8032|nr:hypothetical protein [Streptococcus agalactiae]